MTRLLVEKLTKYFTLHTKGGIVVKGFSNVSFELKEGEFLALSGSSGSGKSSVLKSIYRTYIPSSGNVFYYSKNGKTINLAAADESTILTMRKAEVGYVSQFLRVLPRITALEVVAQPLKDLGEYETKALDEASGLLDFLGIREELLNISPLTFSGGEQQRVNIAQGVIAPKNLLLLDEPTASLDAENSEKVLTKLLEIKRKGTSMIGIFHNRDIMQKVSDKIYNLEEKAYAVSN
ncbi:phosphonate C-P lyase system protein PhnL [Flexistipes sp.]|uniref:phosphonate C-P lyase system protein PhnL n=1 Tax=Flexistipes sp. TaxID=3088135 RepID=UPI002E220916|nr:phosphonate C-P lyase system protein PhnL [Flexistipes sp.]